MALSIGPVAIAGPAATFTFTLSGVEGEKVGFRGGDGTNWGEVSYTCANCAFLVSASGVGGWQAGKPNEPGVVVRLGDGGKTLGFTCEAAQCQIEITPVGDQLQRKTIRRGEATNASSSSAITITVSL
jgi:hypothetical protein